MKKNFHKSCGNCYHYQRIRHYPYGNEDFGGLCLLIDGRGTPQYQAPHYWCKMWKGIKYDKINERRKMKIKMKKLLVTLLFPVFLIGCSFDGTSLDSDACLKVAKRTYPSTVKIPHEKYHYISRDSKGDIHYIEVMSSLEKGITMDVIIMLAEEK